VRNKTTTLYYKVTDAAIKDEENVIDRYLEESTPSKSPWYKFLPINTSITLLGKYIPSTNRLIERLSLECLKGVEEHCNQARVSTIKTCPGILNILNNSILVKAPCDISITISSNGSWVHHIPDYPYLDIVEDHPPGQFTSMDKYTGDVFKNERVIKFNLPLFLSTDGEPYIHLHPQLHSKTPLKVVNGVIGGHLTKIAPLNIITTFEVPEKGEFININIKKGDVLAYLWSNSRLRLKKAKKMGMGRPFMLFHDKFINSQKGGKI
jgi:hypothetical protein